MRYLKLGFVFLLSLILQSTLFPFLMIKGVKPDILIVLVIFLSLFSGPVEGAKLGFLAGLLEDIIVGEFIGLNAFIKMSVGAAVGLLERRFYKENFFIPLVAVVGGSFLGVVLYILLFGSIGVSVVWSKGMRNFVVPISIYNSIIGIIFYNPIRLLNEYLNRERRTH